LDLTILAALFAGLVSFISPCVLPVVPAYLGQIGAVSAVATATSTVAPIAGPRVMLPTSRWRVLPHAIAFVLGFGGVFTLLGLTAYVAAGPLRDNLTLLRQIGGIVLIVLGLNLMGVIRIPILSRTWKPAQPEFGKQPLGGAAARSPLGAFALGTVFAIGWTPCIGPTLGAILTLSAISVSPQVIVLLIAYSLGLGIPFVALALALDNASRFTRPILKYGRQIELIGGALVVIIGLAILFDWLAIFARAFSFLWPQV
jgi:cytochrome c-type biogenesis protein